MILPSDIPDNYTGVILSIVALAGNVIVAYIGFMRDKVNRVELEGQIANTQNNAPTDDHVVELLNQTDTLHRVCRKLLLAKGRKEQAERDTLIKQFEQMPEPSQESQDQKPRVKRVGVIRRISNNI